MLKTNSKKARENIRAYIVESWDIDGRGLSFDQVKKEIIDDFNRVAWSTPYLRNRCKQDAFMQYTYSLPAYAFGDYVLCKGIETLGDILEETEEERSRFNECDAEDLLTRLIYRELFS